jgi:cytochrome c
LKDNQQNANAVAFTADGKSLVSAGYDATVRIWPLRGQRAPLVATLPTPLNTVMVAPDGEIATAGADGQISFCRRRDAGMALSPRLHLRSPASL